MEYIRQYSTQHPNFQVELNQIQELYNEKLWFQLGSFLLKLLKTISIFESEDAVQVYSQFISSFESKLHGVQLIRIVSILGPKTGSLEGEISLYYMILNERPRLDSDGDICLRMCIAYCEILRGNVDTCKSLLDAVKGQVFEAQTAEAEVFSRYYRALAQYEKARGQRYEFYKAALLYLVYSNIDDLRFEDKLNLAVDIAETALTSDVIFDFAQFLQSSIAKSLADSNAGFLLTMLELMNGGKVQEFHHLLSQKQTEIDKYPFMKSQLNTMKQKVVYLAVLNMVLNLNPHDRNISFSALAQECSIPIDQVEYVLMRLMSLKLIRGKIDEVENKVSVEWIQPRELNPSSLKTLHTQLSKWTENVRQGLNAVEENSPELLYV